MSFGDLKLHGLFDILFLGVNQSGHGTNSPTNHKFYKALGQLHGPWSYGKSNSASDYEFNVAE